MRTKNKTIFISSFHPLVSRNIIATDIVDSLIRAGVRVVVLCATNKMDFFQQEYGRHGVYIESVVLKPKKMDFFLRRLSLSALRTTSLKIKYRTELAGRGKWISMLLANFVGHYCVRMLDRFLCPKGTYDSLIKYYQPKVVFSTDIQHEYDVRLLHDAKRAGVSSVGMVRSWDNLTAKGLIRVIPDKLLAQNKIIAGEAKSLHGVQINKIEVVGIPHYDKYVTYTPKPRPDFMRDLGVDVDSRLILFTPVGDRYLNGNSVDCDILEMLCEMIDDKTHILVRLPFSDRVRCMEGIDKKKNVTIERLSKGRFGRIKLIELTKEDDDHLIDTLRAVDLVVAGPSTISVDAVFFNKPVILIGFDGYQKRPYYDSVRRYYDYDHFGPILKSGGVYVAQDKIKFKKAVNDYLRDLMSKSEGRYKLIQEQAYKLDGQSSRRVADIILASVI